jgi:hypothetical protein
VYLNDGTILITDKTPKEIGAYLENHSHITIEGELYNKFLIERCKTREITEVEMFIATLSLEAQRRMRSLIVEREKSGGKTSLQIAKNIAERNKLI